MNLARSTYLLSDQEQRKSSWQENGLRGSKVCKKAHKISDMRFATKRPVAALCSNPNSFYTLFYKILNERTFSLTFSAPTSYTPDFALLLLLSLFIRQINKDKI